jgi:phosphonate transport system substrate-binding protein
MHEAGKITVQYILLVRQDSKIESLADLRGRTLTFHRNPRLSLAQMWLDMLLAQEGYPSCSAFAGTIKQSSKLSDVVLPVFFHATDACVVTRSGFDTMVELNPQVGRQLKVIATSMELVPFVLAFRADYESSFKDQLLAAFRDLHRTPAGLQILNIFHGDKLEDLPASGMNSALELLDRHALLAAGADATRPLPPGGAAQTSGGVSP